MSSDLKSKAVKGIVWNIFERFGLTGTRVILGIILARLLTPDDYGLIGMINVFFALAMVFVESGFSQAFVQKKEVNNKDANTIFFTNLLISFLFYGILWVCAPWISNFYNQPLLTSLVRVMGLIVIINGFNVIQTAKVVRDVNFKLQAKVSLASSILSGLLGITAAYYGLGVWSLVIQSISNRLVATIGLWIWIGWKPSWQFSFKSLENLFSFGSWMLGSSLIKVFFNNVYVLVIGKLFPVSQLGFYSKAKHFQKLASQNIASAIGTVSFPILSRVQENKEEIQAKVKQFLQYTLFIMTPLLVTLIVIAKPFVIILLTEKWAPMIPYFQLLLVSGILYPIHLVNTQALVAQGRSSLNFKLNLVKNFLRLLNIIIMYRFGVLHIIIGEVFLSFAALFLNTYFTNKYFDYGFLKQWKDFQIFILSSTILGTIIWMISNNIDNLWIRFVFGILSINILYLGILFLFKRDFLIQGFKLKKIFIK